MDVYFRRSILRCELCCWTIPRGDRALKIGFKASAHEIDYGENK